MADNQFSVAVPNPLQALLGGEQAYKDATQDRAFTDAASAIKSGDNKALMDALLRAKQIGPAIEIAKLDRQQAASDAFSQSLGGIFGQPASPGSSSAPSPQPVAQNPLARLVNGDNTVASARAPVQGSPRVWGDQEAVNAGIYENPNPERATVAQNAGVSLSPQGVSEGFSSRAGTPQAPGRVPQAGVSPSLGGVSLDRAVPALLQAASNPALPKEQQETARMLLGKALDQYPQEIRKLEIFKQRPDLFELALQEKRAGATTINTAEGMDAAQTKARIEIDKHAVSDLSKKVASGRAAVPLLNQMMAINDKTPGGWAGAAAPYLAKAAASFGMDVPEGASNAELFNAMARQFVPSIRDPGSTSNYEQSLYMQAVPSLSQSPEGRGKIAEMMKAQLARNAETLAVYRQYVGRPELDQKLAELDAKSIFTPDQKKFLEASLKPQNTAPSSFNDRFNGQSTSTGVKWSIGQ